MSVAPDCPELRMIPVYREPHFTFRFADDRLIPRFHLPDVPAGHEVSVIQVDPDTGARLRLLARSVVGEAGWVDLEVPLRVRAGDAFIAVPVLGEVR
jgi:hypothetical protein